MLHWLSTLHQSYIVCTIDSISSLLLDIYIYIYIWSPPLPGSGGQGWDRVGAQIKPQADTQKNTKNQWKNSKTTKLAEIKPQTNKQRNQKALEKQICFVKNPKKKQACTNQATSKQKKTKTYWKNTHTHTHARAHAHTRAHTHTHTHRRTHAHTRPWFLGVVHRTFSFFLSFFNFRNHVNCLGIRTY